MISIYLAIVAGAIGLLTAVILSRRVLKQPTGNETVTGIGELIQQGAMAFLKREYMILSIFVVAIFIILSILIDYNLLDNPKISELNAGGKISSEGQIPLENRTLNSSAKNTIGLTRSSEILVRTTGDIALEDGFGNLVLNGTDGSSTNAGDNMDLEGATGITI